MATKKKATPTKAATKKRKATKPQPVSEVLWQATKRSGRSLYEIGKSSGVDYSILHRFVNSGSDVSVSKVDALAAALDLELAAR